MMRVLSWSTDPGSWGASAGERSGEAARPLTADARAIALIRAAAGLVFIVSGALKLLFENQGVLRFTKLGLPAPGLLATGIGVLEIVAGGLVLVGLFARAAALALALDMVVALALTKLPLLWGAGPEPVAAAPKTGPLAFLYQSRLDLTMLAIMIAIVLAGAGAASLDARRRAPRSS